MKIRLDENISQRVFKAVNALTANRAGFEVSHNRMAGDAGKPDPLWIKSFAEDDGTAIVSGDYNILQNWPDLIAYIDSGLVAYFPPPQFKRLKGYGRAALLIRWWPALVEHAKTAARGPVWRIPMVWTPNPSIFKPLKDPRIDAIRTQEQIEPAPKVLEFRPRSGGG